MLGKGYGVLSSTLVTSPNARGLTVAGSTSSGIGSSPALTINTCPAFQTQTDYAVLTPTQYSATVDTLGLSPSVTYDATGVFGVYQAWAGGESQNWVGVRDDLFPITLSAPNPLTNPLLGDGTNQEVYDSGSPGRVNVPAVISVLGANTDDTGWLVSGNHVDVAIVPAISGQQPHTWDAFENYIGFGGYFTFVGLPTAYNGSVDDFNRFGNHLAILKVDGHNSQSALFQTFFDMYASNWPSSNGYDPNWFHYYQQAYTPPQPDIEPVYFNANLGARGLTTIYWAMNPVRYSVQVGPDAPGDDIMLVFGIDPTTNMVKKIGGLSIRGIHCFVRVMSHEEEHVHLFKEGIVVGYDQQTGPPPEIKDADGDGIPDDWEKAHHLDPNNDDTTDQYQNATGNNVGKGDVECLCDIFALGEVNAHQSLWQQDWGAEDTGFGYTGLQYGKRPLYFPWQYIDDASYSISTSLPNSALTSLP